MKTLKFTAELRKAAATGQSAYGAISGAVNAVFAEYKQDAGMIRDELFAVVNLDYPVLACRKPTEASDNPHYIPSVAAGWIAFKKATERAGIGAVGGKVTVTYSTTTENKEKVRTVAAEFFSQQQIDTATERAEEDAATERKRAEQDTEASDKAERMRKQAMTEQDIAAGYLEHMRGMWPDHSPALIVAEVMALIDAETVAAEASAKKTGTK